MNSKIFSVVLLLCFAMTQSISGQSTATKTAQDLKKAEKVTKAGKALVNVFKKKKKSGKDNSESTINESNEVINDSISNENDIESNSNNVNKQINDITLTKDAAILFEKSISKTNNSEKNEITKLMNIVATDDGKQFYINDQYSKDFPFTVFVYPVDLNNDSVEEIAIVYGHPAISGDNVISTLFIKNDRGHYAANFGFMGSLVILPNGNNGYPKIAIGGPGFEFPVWHWNGKNYTYYGKITDAALEKSNPLFLEEASRLYVESISN